MSGQARNGEQESCGKHKYSAYGTILGLLDRKYYFLVEEWCFFYFLVIIEQEDEYDIVMILFITIIS